MNGVYRLLGKVIDFCFIAFKMKFLRRRANPDKNGAYSFGDDIQFNWLSRRHFNECIMYHV